LLLVLIAAAVAFFSYQNNNLVVERFDIADEQIGSLRIVQLSDLHGKQFGPHNQLLREAVLAENPDLIVVTGDMIHRTADNRDEIVAFFAELNQVVPVVAIPGNQEWSSHVREEFLDQLRGNGVVILENEIFTAQIAGNTIQILGLDERYSFGSFAESSRVLLDELSGLPGFRIVLSHYPQYYAMLGDYSYLYHDFDLMFAGHAHGGQFNLPIFGPVYAHGQGIRPTYTGGLYDRRLVVSPGLGNSSFPLRLFNYPQINVVAVN
jgi:predicted MPP superfamily phosphohydrolase